MPTTNPHDALFKAAYSRPDIARSELELLLPAAVLARLDLASLDLQPGSFVDEALRHARDVSSVYNTNTLLEVAGAEGKEDVVTAAEQLINQGLAERLAEGIAKGYAEGYAKGITKGFRTAIDKVLAVRGMTLTAAGRARLDTCSHPATLERWHECAITATTEDDIFSA